MPVKYLLLGGNRVVGKDTFYHLLSEIVSPVKRIAFADPLKAMAEPVCHEIFGKPIGRLSSAEKEIFRPILLAIGKTARTVDIDFWVKKGLENLRSSSPQKLFVFSDVRYSNEYKFLKASLEENDGEVFLLWVDRIGAPEPTSEELIHGPGLKKLANHVLQWGTDPSLELPRSHVKEIYEKFLR